MIQRTETGSSKMGVDYSMEHKTFQMMSVRIPAFEGIENHNIKKNTLPVEKYAVISGVY